MVTILHCPLCEWIYEYNAIDPRWNENTLASVFGPGVALTTVFNQRLEETERALESHLKTHSLVDWTRKVTQLEGEIRRLRQSEKEMRLFLAAIINQSGGELFVEDNAILEVDMNSTVESIDVFNPVRGRRFRLNKS